MTYRELLENRSFRNLWLGQAVSQLGDALYYLVFLFMVDKLTGNPAMVGAAGVAQTLPFLLLSLYAGVVVDRRDRRQVMLFADISSALILGLFGVMLCFDPTPPAWSLIGVGAALSCVNVFFAPAKSAAIPRLVPAEALTVANGLSMATQSLMPFIGMGLSGTVLAALYSLSPTYFFVSSVGLNGLSFAVSALFIALLPAIQPEASDTSTTGSPGRRAFADMVDGLRYMRREPVLLVMLLLSIAIQFFIAPFMVVYVEVNREWFGGAYGTLALCEGGFFLGMIVSGMTVGKLKVRYPGIAFIWGLAIIGITVAAMAFSRPVWLFAFWNFIAGLGLPLAQIPMTTYIQTTVPDAYRGRVNALLTMAGMGVQPLAIGLGGLLLSKIGPVTLLLGMGIGMTLAALAGYAAPAFRRATLTEAGSTGTHTLV